MSLSRKASYERQELDVPFFLVIFAALALLILVYLLALPFQDTYLGRLIYDRGFTQPLTLFLAGMVISVVIFKYLKLATEYSAIGKNWIPDGIDLEDPNGRSINNLIASLTNSRKLIAVRCCRVLYAYTQSGSRKTASELALDDSAFYLSASESSYTIPRILVWAIPLLGFIGTVIGISQAVSGFSGFLEQAGEIDQIRTGIGTVTSGLAVAFDTTLLALFLSVVVMIPLVLVERWESRLLLSIDVYINDRLLPKLRDPEASRGFLDEKAIAQAVEKSLKENLPQPKDLIEPAHIYAQKLVEALTQKFVQEMGSIQTANNQLIQQVGQVNQATLQDRQNFLTVFNQQQEQQKDIVQLIKNTVEEIKQGNLIVAHGLAQQAQEITQQLNQAAVLLGDRVEALEQSTLQVSQIIELQKSLDQMLNSLEKTAQLEQSLAGLRVALTQLQPILTQLQKPRKIMLLEQDN
ncbi:MotA/TolQ/ExbB proton channel family protein [Spirulina subsalsa]|uniref:MotA/TolQ/ExbB proton channel family protein n=1 Tax=Spirulina subsalsa TaxID=54311 RepID=UPI000301DF16|nr:MotA/TolQ/ExbB proton channel family protein [Spirulina subsalsa]